MNDVFSPSIKALIITPMRWTVDSDGGGVKRHAMSQVCTEKKPDGHSLIYILGV